MPLSYNSLLARPLLRQSLLPLLPWLYMHQAETKEPPPRRENEESLPQSDIIAEEVDATNSNQLRRDPDMSD